MRSPGPSRLALVLALTACGSSDPATPGGSGGGSSSIAGTSSGTTSSVGGHGAGGGTGDAAVATLVGRTKLPGVAVSMAFDAASTTLWVAYVHTDAMQYASGGVVAVDATTDAVSAPIPLPGDAPRGVALAPDRAKLYVGHGAEIAIVDTKARAVAGSIALPAPAGDVEIDPTGARVTVVTAPNPGAPALVAIDVAKGAVVSTAALALDGPGARVAVDPQGGAVHVVGADASGTPTVLAIDAATMTVTRTTPVGAKPAGPAPLFASLAALPGDALVGLFDPPTLEHVSSKLALTLPSAGRPTDVRATPLGADRWLVSAVLLAEDRKSSLFAHYDAAAELVAHGAFPDGVCHFGLRELLAEPTIAMPTTLDLAVQCGLLPDANGDEQAQEEIVRVRIATP
jgi:hypothetical protein